MTNSSAFEAARQRVCLALDTSDPEEALGMVELLGDAVGSYKVGKQLFTSCGHSGTPIVQRIREHTQRRSEVFLDLKFHDTPQTVKGACEAAVTDGVFLVNVHIAGGEAMCKAGLEGLQSGAARSGASKPKLIGVTVLTSLSDEDLSAQGLGIQYSDLVRRRAELAKAWGLDGIVCSAREAAFLEKELGSDFLYVTPGISWQGAHGQGQKQIYSPVQAVQECSSSLLVIGSAITKASNPLATAQEIVLAMSEAM